jgi:signal peptidase I
MLSILGTCRRWLGTRIFRWVAAVAVGIGVGVCAGHSILSAMPGPISVVQGSSMVPTFEPGARIYTAPVDRPLRRGDIILVKDGKAGRAIKRIIGLPGEKVHLWRGYVFVNGKLLREPYLPKYTFTHPDQEVKRGAFALGSGSYFVLGDNRTSSYDSRNYGPVYREAVLAIVPQAGAVPPEFTTYDLPVYGRETGQSGEEQPSECAFGPDADQ